MEQVNIIRINLAKRSFQLHGARADGSVAFRRKVSREKFLYFLAALPRCVVAMEVCASAHHWGREIMQLGHDVSPGITMPWQGTAGRIRPSHQARCMRFVLSSACLFLVATAWHGAVAQPLNKDNVRQLSADPPPNQETLQAGTFHGCVHIPARGFIQRLMVGFERTGERCSVTVQRGNTVQVSFLGDAVIPLVRTSTERSRTDLFVGELGADQVLIFQHRRGEVVSITQTVYDANGDVVYGRSGVGDFIRECVLAMTTSERSADRERCKK